MEERTYTCDNCGEVYRNTWTEAEERAEQKENGWENEPCGSVCDDCYKKIMAWIADGMPPREPNDAYV